MDVEMIALIVTHAVAFLAAAAAGIKFVASQSARVARTEERITRLEIDLAKLAQANVQNTRVVSEVQERLARIEVQIVELQKGQERIIGLLDQYLAQAGGRGS